MLFPSIDSNLLLTAHLLFFPSNLIYILAPTGNIKEGLLQHDGYSSRRNYIITSRNKYDVSSVTNRELNSELSVGGLNSCLNMERRLSKEHFWQGEFLNKQAFVPTEELGLYVRFHEAAYRAFYWFLVGRGIGLSRLACLSAYRNEGVLGGSTISYSSI